MNHHNASNTSKPTSLPASKNALSPLTTQIIFSFISLLSFFGNLLVLLFCYKHRRTLLKKNFYFLVACLALCDTITGVLIFICPRHIFFEPVFEPSSGIALGVFCEVFYSRSLIFVLGSISIYICLLITIDRWFAIVKPMRYKRTVTKAKLLAAMLFSVAMVLAVTWLAKTRITINTQNPPGQRCVYQRGRTYIPNAAANIMAYLGVPVRTLVPSVLITSLYAHMLYRYRNASHVTNFHGNAARKRITLIACVTSAAIVVCWFPNQCIHVLDTVGVIQSKRTKLAESFGVLAMLSSAINPFIYGLTSSEFYDGYCEVLRSCYCWLPRLLSRKCCIATVAAVKEPRGNLNIAVEPAQGPNTVDTSF